MMEDTDFKPRCVEDKLQIARIRLQETKLEKTGLNKFSNYTYFQLADFLPKIQEICGSLELFGQVSFTADMATLTITNTEAREQSLTFTSPMSTAALKGCHDVQNLGAVQTYLRRYLWVMAFEIVEHDPLDSGAENGKKKPGGTSALAWETLTDEEKKEAEDTGNEILLLWGNKRKQEAVDLLRKNQEPSFKTAVWSMLSSAMRSEIKKMEEERRKAEK
jgi:hypothetical protein